MSVQARTLMFRGKQGQSMRRFESKFTPDFHVFFSSFCDASIHVRESCGEGIGVRHHRPILFTEHGREVVASSLIDGKSEDMNTGTVGFSDGLSNVADAIIAFVAIVVGGFPVAEQ